MTTRKRNTTKKSAEPKVQPEAEAPAASSPAKETAYSSGRGIAMLTCMLVLTWAVILGGSGYVYYQYAPVIKGLYALEAATGISAGERIEALENRVTSVENMVEVVQGALQVQSEVDPASMSATAPLEQTPDIRNKNASAAPEATIQKAPEPETIFFENSADAETLVEGLSDVNRKTVELEEKIFSLSENMGQTQNLERARILLVTAVNLRERLRLGEGFAKEVEALSALQDKDATLARYIKTLGEYQSGVKTRKILKERFSDLTKALAKVGLRQKENPSLAEKALIKLSNVITVRRVDAGEGASPMEEALAKAEEALRREDVETAAAALKEVQPQLTAEALRWVQDVENLAAAEHASEELYDYVVGLGMQQKYGAL